MHMLAASMTRTSQRIHLPFNQGLTTSYVTLSDSPDDVIICRVIRVENASSERITISTHKGLLSESK